ncbi:hypothetical protein [Sphingobium ummariense]
MTSAHHRFAAVIPVGICTPGLRGADPLPRLLVQLAARAGSEATVLRATSRPWASALFQGRRHAVTLRFGGRDAASACRRFAEGIEEVEWKLTGHFVADITVDSVHPDEDGKRLELSALTIEDW